ncbi:hypothetical protein BK661_10180 [Pseudomonas frederiksbergensis]|uniref:Uncharacterized protein n=1 Tax=Pseudomonas frederiksbergensis TaxID=104087 RepID=A0A423J9T0_9PSED|nr:hypothetical protein BK661_10180 [Pseudomonas frederiksbergensis]
MSMDLFGDSYQQIITWRRLSDSTAVRYVCFLNLQTSLYAVQSADFYSLPLDDSIRTFLDRQLIELFIEISPRDRSKWHPRLTEAMDNHDAAF